MESVLVVTVWRHNTSSEDMYEFYMGYGLIETEVDVRLVIDTFKAFHRVWGSYCFELDWNINKGDCKYFEFRDVDDEWYRFSDFIRPGVLVDGQLFDIVPSRNLSIEEQLYRYSDYLGYAKG